MSNIPLFEPGLVVEHLSQISFFPDTRGLVLRITRREKLTEYQMEIEIRPMALREIIGALQKFASKMGTSIEDLTKQNSVQ